MVNPAEPARIILIDDHPFILDALKLTITVSWPGAEVKCAESLEEACSLMEDGWSPRLAMLDLGLPGYAELEALHAFRSRAPEVPVVVFSGLESREHTLMAIDSGAMGFIPKKLGRSEVIAALQTVMRGELYVPRLLFQGDGAPARTQEGGLTGAQWGARGEAINGAGAAAPAEPMSARLDGLTERQREVMGLMLQGLANKVIARRLDITEGTVKNHISHVLEAMGVTNRVQAVLAASAAGLRVARHD